MYLDTFFSSKINFSTDVVKLSENMAYHQQATEWADSVWGYLENFQTSYADDILAQADRFYIMRYQGNMIGMFCLYEHDPLGAQVVDKLDYVYIHPNFRHFGLGKSLVEQAKIAARRDHHADTILLETLDAKLNKFYEKLGAKFVCDSRTLDTTNVVETSLLRMDLI